MSGDAGGWLWLVIDVAFVLLLAAALAYGVVIWRRRRKDAATEDMRDAATRRVYDAADRETS
jgi:uncharacterized iron-regulated membrane protein